MTGVFDKQPQSGGGVFGKGVEQAYQPPANSNQNITQQTNTQSIGIVYAGFWDRVRANIIDAMVGYLIIPLLFNLVFYFKDGDTIGYKIIGAKIRKDDGNYGLVPGGGSLIGRHLVRYISFMAIFLGVIWTGFEGKKRSWHDMVVGTVVIKSGNGYPGWSMFFIIIFAILIVLIVLAGMEGSY